MGQRNFERDSFKFVTVTHKCHHTSVCRVRSSEIHFIKSYGKNHVCEFCQASC